VFRFEIAYLLGATAVNSLCRQGFRGEDRVEPCSRPGLGRDQDDRRYASSLWA